MKIIKTQIKCTVDLQEYTAELLVVAPDDTNKDLDKIRLEIDRLLASWIKTKIEKG